MLLTYKPDYNSTESSTSNNYYYTNVINKRLCIKVLHNFCSLGVLLYRFTICLVFRCFISVNHGHKLYQNVYEFIKFYNISQRYFLFQTRKRTHLWPGAGCIHRQRPSNIV